MGVQLDAGGGKKRGIAPNINVTPLVDVVLVLLIIFMVIIPNMQDGKTIEMVKVGAADKNSDSEPITITIDRQEICSFDTTDMTVAGCKTALREAFAADPRRRVLLRGDASLPYRVMRDVFHEAQEIGFGGVSLAVGVAREWSEEEGG